MIPAANLGSGASSIFAAAMGQPTHWREDLIRLDHDFNSKLRFTFRAIHDSWDTTKATVTWGGESFPTIGTHFVGPGVEMVARLTATVSPTLLNEFVASYTTDHIRQNNTILRCGRASSVFTMPGLVSQLWRESCQTFVFPVRGPMAAASAKAQRPSLGRTRIQRSPTATTSPRAWASTS